MTLPHRADVQRQTRTSDGEGGSTTTWPNVLANIPCFVQPTSGRKRAELGDSYAITHDVYHDRAGMRQKDRVVFNGRNLNVVIVRRMDEREGYYHAECVEAEHG